MKKYFRQASILSSGLLIILLYTRYYWVNSLLVMFFGMLYWFIVLSTVVSIIYTIKNFRERKTDLLVVILLNIISLTIFWLDYDFIEENKSPTILIAQKYRSNDEGIILKLRKDLSFEIYQTSGMLSSHTFNYGNYLVERDTIYLHFKNEITWGKFKNRKLGKLVLIKTTESMYGKGYLKFFKDYPTYISEFGHFSEPKYFRFEIIEKINTSL